MFTEMLPSMRTAESFPSSHYAHSPAGLVSHTIPWTEGSLLQFLRLGAGQPRIYWENSRAELSFAGYGAAGVLTANGRSRFATIRHQASQLFAGAVHQRDGYVPALVRPRLFGGFAFSANSAAEGIWSSFPDAYFVLPRYQLTQYQGQTWLTINELTKNRDVRSNWLESAVMDLSYQSPATQNGTNGRSPFAVQDSVDETTWMSGVKLATSRIKQGELRKVVLARPRRVTAEHPLELTAVLAHLQTRYPDCYRFLIEPNPGHAFFGATPELLAEVTGRQLFTVALAGSIRRGNTPDEDAALGAELLASPKEREEHALVVEAVRENLRPLTTHLHIQDAPNLYRLNNIQHLQTPIRGLLTARMGILPLVEALHPTPALGGTPRQVALRLIEQIEPFERGWYAGPVGWLDAEGDGAFAVAIRSAVSHAYETTLFAGAGIVADSDPQREWQETGLKFRPMMEAISSEQ